MKKNIVVCMLATAMLGTMLLSGCSTSTKEVAEETTETTDDETEDETVEVEVKNQSGTVTFDIDMTQYDAGKTVRVWLPVPQTDEYQEIADVVYEATGAEAELTEDALGNQMMYVEWNEDAEAGDRKATLSFHVSRDEIICPEWNEEGEIGEDMSEYLAPSSTIPVDGEVKELADEITKEEDTVLGKARAIYDWIIANMNRDESVVGCGKGDVCTLIETKVGKCTDINSVFVGLCRAAGIPAREIFGIRINDTTITKNQHCWAQFYLPGTGWVSADPADVLKAVLKNEWDKDAQETKDLQEYYWGSCDELRVGLSTGRDLTLSPKQDGEALNNFGYPYAEVDGAVVDYYAPDTFLYEISFVQD